MIVFLSLLAIAALAYVAMCNAGRSDRYEAALREIAAWQDNGNGTARKLSRIAREALK